jgi:flagellar hook-length control protein FliK
VFIMVQLAMDHLLNLPPAEPIAAAAGSPTKRDDDASFDKHLRQAGHDHQPPAESPAQPAKQKTPTDDAPPAGGDAHEPEAQQQTGNAAATEEGEPTDTNAGQEPTADQEGQTTDTSADDRQSKDKVELLPTGGVAADVTAAPTGAQASEESPLTTPQASEESPLTTTQASASAAEDNPAQVTAPAPNGDSVNGSVKEVAAVADDELPATLPSGKHAATEKAAATPPETTDTQSLNDQVPVASVAADREATESHSGAARSQRKGTGHKGNSGKTSAVVSQTDGGAGADAAALADAAATAKLEPNSDPAATPLARPHDVAPLAPAGPTGAEPLSGSLRADAVTHGATERLTESQGAARSQATGVAETERNTVDTARFVQRVARGFLTSRVEAGREIRLRLHPPELGHLRLQIRVQDGVLTAHMETENHLARTLLLDQLAGLRNRLAEHDIKIDRFEVDLMQQPPNESPDHTAADDRPDRRQALPPRTADRHARDSEPPTEVARRRWTTGDGQLNIVI